MKAASLWAKWIVGGPPFLYLLIFFALPGLIVVFASFMYPGEYGGLATLFPLRGSEDSGLTLENYQVFFSDWVYVQIFAKSFGVAALTTLICLIAGYPLAEFAAQFPSQHRRQSPTSCIPSAPAALRPTNIRPPPLRSAAHSACRTLRRTCLR